MELSTLGIRTILPGRENATREFAAVVPANKKKMSGIKNLYLDILYFRPNILDFIFAEMI